MRLITWSGRYARAAAATAVVLLVTLQIPLTAFATSLVQLSTDTYTDSISQHKSEVEPDNFSYGSTIVNAFQVARTSGGGSANIGFATSTDSGASWHNGFLPGTTVYAGGSMARISDPAVAYDAKHNVWLISALPVGSSVNGIGVTVSRSTDGGMTWGNPIYVAHQGDTDKDWITCDDTASSPFYGHCYVEWDQPNRGNFLQMSTSTDGGLTWGSPRSNGTTVIGGQPLVQPNGTVIVPIDSGFEGRVMAFRSTNGGASWTSPVTIAGISNRFDPANIRSGPLPSAAIDASGKVYVVWEDCRFESGCGANDIVMSTSTNGTSWSAVTRVAIGSTNSGADYFLPGFGVDKTTSGSTAHLGLVYYYYPNVSCNASSCQLDVGFVSSTDGGAHWTTPTQLAGPMNVQWLPNTTNGYMVGDYMATSFAGGKAYPIFAVASAPSGGLLQEAMYTVVGGLTPAAGTQSSSQDQPVAQAVATRLLPHTAY